MLGILLPIRLSFLVLAPTSIIGSAAGDEHPLPRDFTGFQLIQVTPKTKDHHAALVSLKTGHAGSSHVDFWRDPSNLQEPVEILASPYMSSKLMKDLEKEGMIPTVKVDDMGKLLEADQPNEPPSGVAFDRVTTEWTFDLNVYQTYVNIVTWLKQLAAQNRDFVKYEPLGNSFEGKEIPMVKLGYERKNANGEKQAKPAFFLDAGIHAREWISHATALHFIDKLVSNYTLHGWLRDIDVYVVPVLNPDGYNYTWTKDRFWRKTRSSTNNGGCPGVDGNRNFAPHWAETGASHNPCDETYAGVSAISEPETRALANFLIANRHEVKIYCTLHSYSNMIMYPWSYHRNTYPTDVEDLKRVAQRVSNTIRAFGGSNYRTGTGSDLLYEAAGGSDDFAKSIGIKYSFLIELTDTKWGFALPQRFIGEVAKHMDEGLLVFADEVRKMAKDGPTFENDTSKSKLPSPQTSAGTCTKLGELDPHDCPNPDFSYCADYTRDKQDNGASFPSSGYCCPWDFTFPMELSLSLDVPKSSSSSHTTEDIHTSVEGNSDSSYASNASPSISRSNRYLYVDAGGVMCYAGSICGPSACYHPGQEDPDNCPDPAFSHCADYTRSRQDNGQPFTYRGYCYPASNIETFKLAIQTEASSALIMPRQDALPIRIFLRPDQ